LAVVGVAALVAIVLWIAIERTKMGSILRAGSENAEMVGLLGINVDRVFMATFALGAALAGLAGVLIAPLRGVEPFMSAEALGIASVVVVVGGHQNCLQIAGKSGGDGRAISTATPARQPETGRRSSRRGEGRQSRSSASPRKRTPFAAGTIGDRDSEMTVDTMLFGRHAASATT
jgi:hypothetical protein